MDTSPRRTFDSEEAFEAAWGTPKGGPRSAESPVSEIAEYVASELAPEGFRLFHNGGLPLINRRHGDLWEEIVFQYGSAPDQFAVRFHLNHEGVAAVRARFWKPSIRAPKTVASGDIGLLEEPAVHAIWSTHFPARTGASILNVLDERVLPWFALFDDPPRLRDLLFENQVPLVDLSTGVELLLAEFDVREARRFLRSVEDRPFPPIPAPKFTGFDLAASRIPALTAYYRL